MKSYWLKIKKSEFFIAISTTGFTSFLQILSGILVNKIIALKIGPNGIALLGQFANFRDMMTTFGTGSFGQGVTKYISDKNYKNSDIISTSIIFSTILSIVLGLVMIIFRQNISQLILKDHKYQFVIFIFAITITFFSLNNLLLAIINGLRNYIFLAKVKTINSIVSLIVSISLCWYYGINGALIALSLNTSAVLILSILVYYFSNENFLNISFFIFNKKILKKLLGFTLMILISSALRPLVDLLIRNHIIEHSNINNAGLWESMKRISTYYTQVFTLALATYYLPKLSSLDKKIDLKREILSGYKKILPIYIIFACIIYILKDPVINLLFSNEFMQIKEFFLPQLLGDFFMLASYLTAYLMLAKAMTRTFIITQILMYTAQLTLGIYMFTLFEIKGLIWANTINYFIYNLLMIFIFRKILFIR